MIKEHDCVVLTTDLQTENLTAGDVVVVDVHAGGKAFVVEFMNLRGGTLAVTTLHPNQIRRVSKREVAHARELRKT